MNCNCLAEIKTRIINEQPMKGKKVTRVSFPSQNFVMKGNTLDNVLVVPMDLEVESRKTKIKNGIAGSFCPFCGRSTKDTTSKDSEV